MVSYINGGMQANGIWKQDPEANIRDENGECRRLHNEELHSLYRSPNIGRAIKSSRLRWTGYVVRMKDGRSAFKILIGKPIRKKFERGPGSGGPRFKSRSIFEFFS